MKLLSKYLIRIVAISLIHGLYSIFDHTISNIFSVNNSRDFYFFIGFIIYGLIVWWIAELIYIKFENLKNKKKHIDTYIHRLIPIYIIYGIIVSICFSSIYYYSLVLLNEDLTEWPGRFPLLHFEMNYGIFGFYTLIAGPMGLTYYFKNIQKEKLANEKLKKENIQSKFEVLKNQIDPHFFFNSLSVLTSLVYKDADLSADYITQLSKIYRYILDISKKSLVKLESELKFIDSYIFLMKIRFADNLNFEIHISDTTKKSVYIPPNTLQLLAENAIKHNKLSDETPLLITITENNENIIISNNLNKRTLIEKSSGIGLENIKLRYELLKNKRIQIQETKDSFTVSLPKYYKNDYESIDF